MSFIYVLIDPQTNEIRYVGKTDISLTKRVYRHVEKARLDPSKCHRVLWLQSLIRKGLRPRIELLQTLPSDLVDAAEIYWIEEMRRRGCDLTNTAPGGTGGPTRLGMKTPRDIVEKQRQAWIGRAHRPESKQRMSEIRRSWVSENLDVHRRTSVQGGHTRWHTNRGIFKPGCEFCESSVQTEDPTV